MQYHIGTATHKRATRRHKSDAPCSHIAKGRAQATQPRAMLLPRDSIHILYKYMQDVFENAIVPQQHPCEGVAQCATRPAREARYTAGKST